MGALRGAPWGMIGRKEMTQKAVNSVQNQESHKVQALQNLKAMCDRDREKVKGIFRFFECPGGLLSFVFKAYRWDPIERFDLQDGEIYTIPLGVAKHLNKNGWYPEHNYLMDETGRPHMKVGQKKTRFGFQSLEFIDPTEIGEATETEVLGAQELTAAEKASLRK